jgi:ADP-ribose pyrophosphatase YjhB (NUDIX family)
LKAAGVLVRARSTGRVLLLLRRDCDCWGTPGGHVEGNEGEMSAAIREFHEETGHGSRVTFFDAPSRHGGYALYYAEVARQFRPVLNREHTAFRWARPGALPLPLHRGLRYQIRKLGVV